ncbi:EAL domain-containing protein [Marinagarivorans algicola]|uniref:EAL domain-containing protein n=1 Tax=Marinagarivorans algicola TaxID=1513270 RepID=UPI00373584A1
MFHFKKIRTRMLVVIMAGASLGLLVLAFAFMLYIINLLQHKRESQLNAELGVLAINIAASVMFEDEITTRELLQGLAVDDEVMYVEVTKKTDNPKNVFRVVEFFNPQLQRRYHVRSSKETIAESTLDSFKHSVEVDGEVIGLLTAYVGDKQLKDQIFSTFVFTIGALISVFILVVFLGVRLQKSITYPIEQLNSTSKKVTEQGDYALRADANGEDELADLARAFNRMLDQIEQRDIMLEKTVKQRTIELERLADEFRYRAFHDSLTGLPNRALLTEQFPIFSAHARRSSTLFAVFLIDLDNFKNINDTLGHDVGDQLLKTVAERLSYTLRSEDLVCRLGGDEFLILVEDLHVPSDAQAIADKLFKIMNQSIVIDSKRLDITMSLGAALYPKHGYDLTSLKRAADIAMYASKEAGKNQYKVFESAMEITAKQRLIVQNDLRSALVNGDMQLYYQPQVYADNALMYGCEVLVRWRHHKYGLLFPDVFIPHAEDSGLVQFIDYYVLEMACKQAKLWLDEGRPLIVSINLSGLHFRNTKIIEKITHALEENKLPAEYLCVELTEAVLISDTEVATKIVKELKTLGLKISLDDFGVGYSSLNYLRTFPFDTVKLDKSFIASILTNPQDQRLTEGIITLASSLNLSVVAEGVENQEQMNYLSTIGCNRMQGYYFLPPRSLGEFERWWDKHILRHSIG